MNSPLRLEPQRIAVKGDGVELAAYRWGNAAGPTLLLVHGYPDSHEVWLPLVRELAADYQIVAYDVRGAGASDIPRKTRDYRLEKLANDLEAVIKAASPERPVHLVAHDWGSIQSWEAVTEPRIQPLLASYTTVSGPCLDHVGHWMRARLKEKRPRALGRVLGQLLSSWYIAFFHTPLLPELLWHSGLARAWPTLLRRVEGVRQAQPNPTQAADGQHGVKLYRANFIKSLFRPRERPTQVPVQLIVPTRDRFVRPQLFQQLDHWAPRLWRREVAAGHWQLLAEPQRLAGWIREFVEHLEGGEASRALRLARVRPGGGSFAGKLVLVTGAGGGIGRATLLEFAERGASVLAADIDLAAAERSAELARALGAEAWARQLDVSDSAQMEAFAASVETEFGCPDLVINNAGIGMAGAMLDTRPEDWERLLRVNLWSVIDGCRLFARQMIEAGKGGHIVNIASAAAFVPSRNYAAYATSKAAVLMLSECLRAELAGKGIGVTAICPGLVNTGIIQATRFHGLDAEAEARRKAKVQRLYRRRNLSAETVAMRIAQAVERNKPVQAVGSEAHLSVAQWRFAPWLSRLLARLNLSA
ncbi:SDR family oxidoreductase [Pseudomonas sp. BN417]|uniref:SDR family oxidoreductase n=1 Tax=Pseudomonas sp. BN417 TaxID=2567890 RepID=UPI0024572033|nr:SDR family oxidoreductase [Pseudomonas sp. BN417]MDH4556695.1 SDR family oxidoreductase [Pseudomonas sp. BN417]